jgi:hypothetical protein
MFEINAYKINNNKPTAKIRPLSVKRDWMVKGTQHEYAYNCFPVVLANTMGYEIYFEEDIEFIWNGSFEEGSTLVTKGKDICYFNRGFATIGLITNLVFKSDKNVSLLIGPVPNQFIDGIQNYSAILSTSFFGGVAHIVLRITKPNEKILLKAGTSVGLILPLSLKNINNSSINILENIDFNENFIHEKIEYTNALTSKAKEIKSPTNWYKKAIDHNGVKIGDHEITFFNLKVIEKKNV